MPLTRTLAALVGTALLVACQDAGQRSVALLEPGNSFAVVRIDGAAAPAGVTLDVGDGGRITGAAPCNRYSGQLTQSGGVMTISAPVMTRRACLDPALTMAETRFGIALGSITAARPATGGIALIDPEGRERLGLVRAGR